MNLTDVAAGNRDARVAAADAVVARDASGRLSRFRVLGDGALMSITLTSDKVLCFDQADEVLDTRRFYAVVMGDAAAGQTAFLASWASIHRRIAFEELWDHGELFIYGALNGGGLGAQGPYGTICVIIDPDGEPALALAVFPDNTALSFTDPAGVPNSAAAAAAATSWTERGATAVIERETAALAERDDNWPQVLCRDQHFLEVIRAGALPLRLLGEIRLDPTDSERFEDLWWRHQMGIGLSVDEMAKVKVYTALLRWKREHGATMVTVHA